MWVSIRTIAIVRILVLINNIFVTLIRIIYCQKRETCEEVATRLKADGIAAAAYHAGTPSLLIIVISNPICNTNSPSLYCNRIE